MKSPRMLHNAFALALAGLAGLGVGHGRASAADISGAYFERAAWEAQARGGDVSAKWRLGWAYASQGDLPTAYAWVADASPRGDMERGYLKAWLAWRSGSPAAALAGLKETPCEQARCRLLALNANWDAGSWGDGQAVAISWLAADKSYEALRYALAACLLNSDLAKFDQLAGQMNWRDDAAGSPWRADILSLTRLRASF